MTNTDGVVHLPDREARLMKVLADQLNYGTQIPVTESVDLRRADTTAPLYQVVVGGEVINTINVRRVSSTAELKSVLGGHRPEPNHDGTH